MKRRFPNGRQDEVNSLPGMVHATCDPDRCESCGCPPSNANFRIVLDRKTVDIALDRAARGEQVLIRDLTWICPACAISRSKCPRCGGPQAGMADEFRWFRDDDGLVTCNPFALLLREKPESCTSPNCENYSFDDTTQFGDARSFAVEQGFPDPYRPGKRRHWGLEE